ncbi:MAG: SpoIIE family protein phosphatase [Terracidiphilus sp.]
MARHMFRSLPWRFAAAAVVLLAQALSTQCVRAQTFDATNLRSPIDPQVPWLLHAGDDPNYARPDFDDSQWTRFDPATSLKTIFPGSHPEIVWYRLHVKVAPDETGLALSEWNISSAFEIYVNGQKIVQNGQVAPFVPYTFDGRLLKRIPDADIAIGSLIVAMRVHISPLDWTGAFPGYYYTNFTLGQEQSLSDHLWMHVIGENSLGWFYRLAGVGLGIVALALFTAQPRQREYLWIFLVCFTGALGMPFTFYRLFHNLPAAWEYVSQPLEIANLIFLTLMYFAFLHVRFGRWIQILLAAATAGMLISMVGTAHGAGSWLSAVLELAPELAILAGVIPVLLVIHLRRGNREAGILLVPSIFLSLGVYLFFGSYLLQRIPALTAPAVGFELWLEALKLGPLVLNIGDIGGCLFVLSLAIIMVLRSTRISHQQAQLESELAAAREVQQVILPEQMETVPGFQIESAYEPAQQVGGDFFQILPAGGGGLLLVIGDVAGKGLPAAMLVSVIVGAIRGVAEYTSEPAELLANLNQRLIGRVNGGFSTALVARISSNGTVTLANAGHLAPYLDGREVAVPGALPLGIQADMRYETTGFHLPAGSRLTFYSDGIVEAQSAKGELFGFERGRELSRQPVAEILEAAKQFGQQDDMTVIAITRDAAVASAA